MPRKIPVAMILAILMLTFILLTPAQLDAKAQNTTSQTSIKISKLWQIKSINGNVDNIAWSPDGSKLAVGTGCWLAADNNLAGGVFVFDGASGRLLWKSQDLCGVASVAWSPDGSKLAAGTGCWGVIVYGVGSSSSQQPGVVSTTSAPITSTGSTSASTGGFSHAGVASEASSGGSGSLSSRSGGFHSSTTIIATAAVTSIAVIVVLLGLYRVRTA